MKKYYMILCVDENASDLEITKAYKNLVKKYNPDNNPKINTNEKLLQIIDAYQKIMNLRKGNVKPFNYNPFDNIYETPSDENDFLDRAYKRNNNEDKEKISEYIKNNYKNIPSKESYGKFIFIPNLFYNKEIKYEDYCFVDGFTEVSPYNTGVETFLGDMKAYTYNYVDKNGNYLFPYEEEVFILYIGRGLFIKKYDDITWSVMNKNGKSKFLGHQCAYNDSKFIFNIVNELNKKYTLETNGKKYTLSKSGIGYPHWFQINEEYPKDIIAITKIKKTISTFVEKISEFDDYSREMYKEIYIEEKDFSNSLCKKLKKKAL